MPTSILRRWSLCGLLCCTTAGCVTTQDATTASTEQPATGLKKLFRPRVSQASFEQEIDEIPSKPKEEYLLHLTFAEWMEDAGDSTRAEQHYREVVKAKPKNVAAILGLVRMDILAGRLTAAEEGLIRAERLDGDSADVAAAYGHFHGSQKDYDKAIESYTKAVQSEPTNADYRYQLALAMVHADRIEAALPHFASTVGDAAGHYNIALILKDKGDLPNAEKHLQTALHKQPNMKEARHWLAEVRREQGLPVATATTAAASQVVPASAQTPARPEASRTTETAAIDLPRQYPLSSRQAEQLQNQK